MKLKKSEIDLMLKYHSPGSRYSYFPSVSYWQNSVSQDGLISHFQKSYDPQQGIDLYIHIPFCESLCTFCGCNIKITKNHKEGISYVDSLEKEWQFFKENITDVGPKISSIYLGGGTPTFLSEKSLSKLFSFLFPEGPQELKEGTVEIDPRFVTLEKLKLFKKYGIKRLSIGVQDLDIDVLENVNRKQSKEKLENVSQIKNQQEDINIPVDKKLLINLAQVLQYLKLIYSLMEHRSIGLIFFKYMMVDLLENRLQWFKLVEIGLSEISMLLNVLNQNVNKSAMTHT